jgi:hypothetical protein
MLWTLASTPSQHGRVTTVTGANIGLAYDTALGEDIGVERGERCIALVNVEKIIAPLGIQPSEFFGALDKPVIGKS